MAVPYTPPPDISKGVAPPPGASVPPPPAVINTMTVPPQQAPPPPHSLAPDGRTEASPRESGLQLDMNYLKTPVGVLSAIITVYAFIGLIVMVSGVGYNTQGAYGFFIFDTVLAFLFSAAVLLIGLMKIQDEKPTLPLSVILVVGFAILAFFTLIASCLVAARALFPRDGACAVIGFLILQLYLLCIAATLPDAMQSVKRTSEQRRAAPLQGDVHPTDFPPAYTESIPGTQPHLSISQGV